MSKKYAITFNDLGCCRNFTGKERGLEHSGKKDSTWKRMELCKAASFWERVKKSIDVVRAQAMAVPVPGEGGRTRRGASVFQLSQHRYSCSCQRSGCLFFNNENDILAAT